MMRSLKKIYFLLLFICLLAPKPAAAQPITAAGDGTGTTISAPEGHPNRFNIEGGTASGENLFHSFEQFGLDAGQVANFLSNPDIENILGRVVGGNASLIDGLLQVSGGASNLFLINPAGMVFGPNAQFSLPAEFTATTANGIQIGDEWFSALGANDYASLIGRPTGFAFTVDSPGSILNAGDIAVSPGSRVRLVGGTVVNTGSLSTPGGEIVIEAVPEAGIVTITPEGSLLSLGIPIETQAEVNGGIAPLTPLALPQLLSRDTLGSATGVAIENGVCCWRRRLRRR
ncbi:MAG: filamentous hemagglutinin N-terminal domain-containing protein [Cyanobacteria bacterium J06635_11]